MFKMHNESAQCRTKIKGVTFKFFQNALPRAHHSFNLVPSLDLGNQSGKSALVFEGKVGDKSLF